MAKYKCNQCGEESLVDPNMETCPKCQSPIGEDDLKTLIEPPDYEASIDTARDAATLLSPGIGMDDEEEEIAAGSSKTALAADLGYADLPTHLKTLATPEEAYASAGKSSSIPRRSLTDDDDKSGDLRDYKIVSEIGQGSFGFVYRAVQVPLDRNVAIKLLKPLPLPRSTESEQSKDAREGAELKVREEFLREAQFTGKLEHPNIVPIHDIGIVTGGKRSERPFYVMKEIKGISWQEVLTEKSREENLDIFNRVVDAMGFAHSRNILHCDLKPENVMLGEFGEVLVVDWGQAINTTQADSYRPGGTPAYCSPEMAQYWCDFGADPDNIEHSKQQIGPRSDVYLLGSILFQVVTSRAPHYGLKGETPADVMVRASRNEIRRYGDFAKDELLQIALRTMRKAEPEINTVEQLQVAMKAYEERKQSIDIRDRAFELLDEAKLTSNYDTYQKAKFAFEESLQLWQKNLTARDGLQQTRLSCAQLALTDQNFDLGLGMLDEVDTEEEVRVKEKLNVGKRRRDRRKRLVGILGLAFAAAVVIGLAMTTYYGNEARKERIAADAAKNTANIAETNANNAIADAKVQKDAADAAVARAEELEDTVKDNERQIAEFKPTMDRLTADKTRLEMDIQEKESEVQSKVAEIVAKQTEFNQKQREFQTALETEQQKVDAAQQDLLAAEREILVAEEAAELLRYKTGITSIEQKVAAGDFGAARRLLDTTSKEEDKSSFEWRRLNLLSHPEVTAQSWFPDEDLLAAKLAGNRQLIALCFNDRIEIRDLNDLQNLLHELKQQDIQSIALSHDGKSLAIGTSGQVQIVDVASGQPITDPLPAQTKNISDLVFSRDGNMLMSVGTPDRIRKTGNLEHELMVWESDGRQWTELDKPRFKGAPARPTTASFSADGQRIVTSSPDAKSAEQFVFVLQLNVVEKDGRQTEKYFEWIKPDRVQNYAQMKSGFVTSIFADEAGNRVISSYGSESQSGLNQIVVWDVDELVPVSLTSQPQESYPEFDPGGTVTVDSRISHLDFNGQVLIAAEDKNLLYWDLTEQGPGQLQTATKRYRGHGRSIEVTGILESATTFVTIATGSDPEVLLTNTSTYRDEQIAISLSDRKLGDGSSPYSIFESPDSSRVMVGNDHGLVSVSDVEGESDSPILKWQTSAWDQHIVTREHLFALCRATISTVTISIRESWKRSSRVFPGSRQTSKLTLVTRTRFCQSISPPIAVGQLSSVETTSGSLKSGTCRTRQIELFPLLTKTDCQTSRNFPCWRFRQTGSGLPVAKSGFTCGAMMARCWEMRALKASRNH